MMKLLAIVSVLCVGAPRVAEALVQTHRSFGVRLVHNQKLQRASNARGVLTMRKGRPTTKLSKKQVNKGGPEKQIDWAEIASRADDLPQNDGDTKAVEIRSETIVLIKDRDDIYGVGASCTTCKYPMLSAKVREGGDDGPNVACGLCGTLYRLRDGKRCGKEEIGGIAGAFGNLMSKNDGTDISVYEVRTAPTGKTYVNMGLKDDN